MPDVEPMPREQLRVLLDDEWGYCGCGTPEASSAALLRLLKLYPLGQNFEELGRWLPDEGVLQLLLYQVERCELAEHGGLITAGWLTERGEAALLALAAEEPDGFLALHENHCVHGFDVTDETHDCMAVSAAEDGS